MSLEERYIPDLSTWTDTGATTPFLLSCIRRVGTTLYAFGGYVGGADSDKIWSAPWATPTVWSEVVGKVMPAAQRRYRILIIGDNLYSFGDWDVGNKSIFTATLADPTTWSDTGSDYYAYVRTDCDVGISGTTLFMGGGNNYFDYADNFITATTANPLSWSTTAMWYGDANSICVNNNLIHMRSAPYINYPQLRQRCLCVSKNAIVQMELRDGFNDMSNASQYWHIGNSYYAVPYKSTSSLYHSPAGNFMNKDFILKDTVPAEPFESQWIGLDGRFYLSNYTTGKIWMSARSLVYAQTQDPNSSIGIPAKFPDGTPTCITRTQLLGFQSWRTTRTDMA